MLAERDGQDTRLADDAMKARALCQKFRTILERCSYSYGIGPASSHSIYPYTKQIQQEFQWWKDFSLKTEDYEFPPSRPRFFRAQIAPKSPVVTPTVPR